MAEPLEAAHNNARNASLGLMAVFFVMLLIIYVIQNQYISKPIMALEKAADQISMGELGQAVTTPNEDEIGNLGKAFERMRLSLQAAMKSLAGKD
jgi:HAMP domain-containing protein